MVDGTIVETKCFFFMFGLKYESQYFIPELLNKILDYSIDRLFVSTVTYAISSSHLWRLT